VKKKRGIKWGEVLKRISTFRQNTKTWTEKISSKRGSRKIAGLRHPLQKIRGKGERRKRGQRIWGIGDNLAGGKSLLTLSFLLEGGGGTIPSELQEKGEDFSSVQKAEEKKKGKGGRQSGDITQPYQGPRKKEKFSKKEINNRN